MRLEQRSTKKSKAPLEVPASGLVVLADSSWWAFWICFFPFPCDLLLGFEIDWIVLEIGKWYVHIPNSIDSMVLLLVHVCRSNCRPHVSDCVDVALLGESTGP